MRIQYSSQTKSSSTAFCVRLLSLLHLRIFSSQFSINLRHFPFALHYNEIIIRYLHTKKIGVRNFEKHCRVPKISIHTNPNTLRMHSTKYPISALPLIPKSRLLINNLTPDTHTPNSHAFRTKVLTESPSLQRRARVHIILISVTHSLTTSTIAPTEPMSFLLCISVSCVISVRDRGTRSCS